MEPSKNLHLSLSSHFSRFCLIQMLKFSKPGYVSSIIFELGFVRNNLTIDRFVLTF